MTCLLRPSSYNVLSNSPLVHSSALAPHIRQHFWYHIASEHPHSLSFNNMAHIYPREYVNDLTGEITPTAVMIKKIPYDWKADDVMNFLSQRKLPIPKALNYLYDDRHVFRGMAFATFASAGESWRVIRELHNNRVAGRRLVVQFKRKRPESTSTEDSSQGKRSQQNHPSHPVISDKAYQHPQAKVSTATTHARERTPPSDSYYLLMSYQKDPVERDKLKQFLAQTKDFQEAVNEFAKNRAKETLEGRHGWSMEDSPILEMRPPTPGEQLQIDEMESRFGISRGTSSSGSVVIRREGEQGVEDVIEHSAVKGTDPISREKEHRASAEQGAELNEGKGRKEVEGRVGDGKMSGAEIAADAEQ